MHSGANNAEPCPFGSFIVNVFRIAAVRLYTNAKWILMAVAVWKQGAIYAPWCMVELRVQGAD